MNKIDGAQTINTARYPRGRTPPSIEQLLHGDGSSCSPGLARDHDHEEYYSHHSKKSSVLMRVREAAKKLRYSLTKKRQGQEESVPPPWGVSLDEDEEDVDPEYLGAPMYESVQAPDASKETARQHPRAITVIPEKHLLPNSVNNEAEQEKQSNPPSPNKGITKTLSSKFGPAYAAVTDTPQAIASKVEGLNVAPPASTVDASQKKLDRVSRQENESNSKTESEEQHETQTVPPKVAGMMSVATPAVTDSAVSGGDGTGEHLTSGQQNWDKGVSVKEYLMQKLEPGEDERALSQVITEAISPRKTPGDMGVVDKVREAVTSLLRSSDQSSQSTTETTNSSSSASVSTYSQQVTEEESHGRILQAN